MRICLTALMGLIILAPAALAQGCDELFRIVGFPGGTPAGPVLTVDDFKDGPVLITMADVTGAEVGKDQNGQSSVWFSYTADISESFGRYTADHTGEPIGIVYDGVLISAPIVMTAIYGQQAMVTGLNTTEEAAEIAQALNSKTCPPDAGS